MRRSSGTHAMPSGGSRCGAQPAISRPSKLIWPSEGRTRPMIVLSVVLLPTPLRPSSPTTSPGLTSRDTPCRMCDLP